MRLKCFLPVFLLVVAMASSAGATVVTKEIVYKDGDTVLKGTLAYDDAVAVNRPGILLFPEWWGHNDYIKRRAVQMAQDGYVAFAADMYGADILAKNVQEAQGLSKPLYENRNLMRRRARAALDALKQQDNVDRSKIAAIGFCMGGTVALELARTGLGLKGVGAFHAGLNFPDKISKGKVKAKILVLNGAADPMVPFEERDKFIEEMQASDVDLQFIQYGGAQHAFTNPSANKFHIKGVAYNSKAERRSFEALHAFFDEIFWQHQ
jgi:dienelactone hydrolase